MLTLYYHPLASYCWKVLIALHESATTFEGRVIDLADPADRAELTALWPLCKFPVLRDEGRIVGESTVIIEYLDRHHPGPHPLLPQEHDAALEVRTWDRLMDNYVHTPMGEIVLDRLHDAHGDTSRAHATLGTAYEMADRRLASSAWIAGDTFSLADCAAAPALFYASTLVAFPTRCTHLHAYFERLVERPSVARTLEEAKPYFESYPFASAIPARFR